MNDKDKILEQVGYAVIDVLCNGNYMGGFAAVEVSEKVVENLREKLNKLL